MYALGMASGEEARELEALCMQYPEIRMALLEAQESIELFAEANATAPPAAGKDRILKALQEEGLIADQAGALDTNTQEHPEIVDIAEHKKRKTNPATFVAATAIILLLLGAIYHVYTVKKLKTEILLMATQQRSLTAELTQYRGQADTLKQRIAVVGKLGVRKLDLQGVAGHEELTAALYWDGATKEVYLLPNKLKILPKGKQYQLWAIVNGKPVSAGVFNQASLEAMQQMKTIQKAEMFAITIEKEGGVETPTLDQMVVAGKI
ncbi:Anti-sigma-K factor rskA [Olivibacter domesticus]|uniref:Anti-sigma-K factor rskA n=2 Tax=Olivibacter domesticus TaxID=407022 RepID=A0A1H7KXV7_OLID1|nr:Anti-sigma-K factor rskA [Olivibacter domesticus]